MRSFRQWLLPLLATASLLLLVAACGAWARSHVLRDEWRARDAPVVREWSSDSGRVAYVRYTVENDPHPEPDRSWQWRRSVPGSGLATRSGGGALTDAGFSFGDEYRLSFRGAGARTVGVKVRAYSVPYWLLAAGAAVMPLAWGRRGYRRHRRVAWAARGQCIACGYDLRGSRDRCAECGVPITEKSDGRA